jgi:hypothetical protein
VRARQRLGGLRRKDYEPPRKPDVLTRPLVVAFDDRNKARDVGDAAAYGHDETMRGERGELHIDRMIDAQAARAIADQRYSYGRPKEAAEQARQDAIEQQRDAGREIAELAKRDAEKAAEEAALGERHGPGTVGYCLLRLVLFLVTLPVDYGAAQGLPLPPGLQALLAVLLGAAIVGAADYAAKKIEDLRQAYHRRTEDPFGYRQDQVLLVAAIALPIAFIGGTTIWRGETFAAEAEMSAGAFDAGAANLALALIALLTFGLGVLAGLAYRRIKPLRAIRRQRRRIKAEQQTWQAACDKAERLQRQAEVTRDYLNQRESKTLEAIRRWAEERKARVAHNAAKQRLKVLRREGRRGAGGTDGPAAVRPMAPGPAGSPGSESADLDNASAERTNGRR